MSSRRPAPAGAILGLGLALAACDQPAPAAVATLAPASATAPLAVLGPDPGFDPVRPPPDWFTGPGAAQSFAVVESDGLAALELRGSATVLGRRIAVPLLAAPFLRWGWRLEPTAPGTGVRLIVGLAQGMDRAAGPGRPGQPPAHDRRIELALVATAEGARVTASAAASAGGDNAGPGETVLLRVLQPAAAAAWMVEAIDLAAVHARLQPGAAQGGLVVTFVAVGGIGRRDDGRALGQMAEIVLSR